MLWHYTANTIELFSLYCIVESLFSLELDQQSVISGEALHSKVIHAGKQQCRGIHSLLQRLAVSYMS